MMTESVFLMVNVNLILDVPLFNILLNVVLLVKSQNLIKKRELRAQQSVSNDVIVTRVLFVMKLQALVLLPMNAKQNAEVMKFEVIV